MLMKINKKMLMKINLKNIILKPKFFFFVRNNLFKKIFSFVMKTVF